MAVLKTSVVTHSVTDIPPSSKTLVENTVTATAITYANGKKRLGGFQSDFLIAEGAKFIYLYSDDGFVVKIGDTQLFTTKDFMYNGSAADFKISNPGSTPIDVNFVYYNY